MCVIWHESLYYLWHKFRNTPDPLLDARFFSYVWPCIKNNQRNRTVGTTDDVARDQGDSIYWPDIHYHTCQYFYNQYPKCTDCKKKEILIDLRGINEKSYSPDEIIIGDVETLEWLVVRGVRIDTPTREEIERISIISCNPFGIWHSVEDQGSDRKMKYEHTSTVHKDWTTGLLFKFTAALKNKVLD